MSVETQIRAVRALQQGWSRVSVERTLIAAEELMSERRTDDFTLNEVGKRYKDRSGRFYCRFDSKDDLVHAVQTRVLERVNTEQLAMVKLARPKRPISSSWLIG